MIGHASRCPLRSVEQRTFARGLSLPSGESRILVSKNRLGSAKLLHPYQWLWEPLESDPSFVLRAMFGTRAVYVDGKIVLCFSARSGPWHGVLVATDRSHHASLMERFPSLEPHSLLPKWLFLADSAAAFERIAERLVQAVRQRDPRIGVAPASKKGKRA